MKFIFSTGSLHSYSLDRCFELARRTGFDGVELMVDHRWDTRQAGYLQRLVDRHSLAICAVHSPFIGNIHGWAPNVMGAIEKSVALAETLAASLVVLHLPERASYTMVQLGYRRLLLPLPGVRRHQRYIDWVRAEMPRVQQATEVILAIENLPAKRFWGRKINPAKWNAYNRQTIGDMIRFPHITLDTTHLATWGLDPNEVFVRWGERVKHVHLSNFNGREHRRPEDGHLRLDRLLGRMAAMGYNHAVSLELHPDALDAGQDDERVAALLANSLAHCRRWAQGEEMVASGQIDGR
jgi:sugar phosphate isomerase/epimerase